MLTMLLLEHKFKSYNWNILKRNSAFDVLIHLYVSDKDIRTNLDFVFVSNSKQ